MNYNSNQSLFARSIGRSESYINRLLTDPADADHGKNLGERLARDIETKLRLAEGWFDTRDASLPDWKAVENRSLDLVTASQTYELQKTGAPDNKNLRDEVAQLAAELASLSARMTALVTKI